MKKILFPSVFVMILLLSSCAKDNPGTAGTPGGTSPGTYTFKTLTYTAQHAVIFQQALSVDDYPSVGSYGANTATVLFYFPTFPTASGTYAISPNGTTTPAAGHMSIVFTDNSTGNTYFGAPNVTGSAAITVGTNGKVNIAITTPVTLANQALISDSGSFTTNVTQQ